MRGLAYRRHQRQRAKYRAIRCLRQTFSPDMERVTPKQVARYAVDRVPCSCSMCGNPRRYFGMVTVQELRASSPRRGEDA
jgi:hypothetical protein